MQLLMTDMGNVPLALGVSVAPGREMGVVTIA